MASVNICGTCGRNLVEVRNKIKIYKEENKQEIDEIEFMIDTEKKEINIRKLIIQYKLNICCSTTLMERIDKVPLIYGDYPIDPY